MPKTTNHKPRVKLVRYPYELVVVGDHGRGFAFTLHHYHRRVLLAWGQGSKKVGQVELHAVIGPACRRDAEKAWRALHRDLCANLEVDDLVVRYRGRGFKNPPQKNENIAYQPLGAYRQALTVVPRDYALHTGLARHRAPRVLAYIGDDQYGRSHWLMPEAARAWRRMDAQAAGQGVALALVSAFRSDVHQTRIIMQKLEKGQSAEAIFKVNAAPGRSEHHSGRALDLTTVDCPPADPEFAKTAAFDWLQKHAGEFGFRLSYPEGNAHGIMYEPWHWCYVPKRRY